jgi:RNA polymerase sigma-70 factor (ECF subfamily)
MRKTAIICQRIGLLRVYNDKSAFREAGGVKEQPLIQTEALNRFLAGVERRAFRMAQFAAANPDDALDIVQDAMLVFVRSYANKPESEWGALFHRTLQSRITDWQRRTTVRNRFRAWLGRNDGDEEEEDPLHTVADTASPDAEKIMIRRDMAAALEKALRALPLRQRQAFLLRAWEGLDVAQTAHAMGCSQGSVKTHYSRAVHALREHLEEYLS